MPDVPNMPNVPNELGTPIQSGASAASFDSLDFERADRTSGSAPVCASCAIPIADRYYTVGSHLLCEACHFGFQNAKAPGNAASRFFGAAGLGVIAAAIGCALWMVVTQLTGYEIGLIAIAVGYIVGISVHVGARRVGGLVYQWLAVFLTYSAIVMTYVPTIASQLDAGESALQGWIAAIPLAYALPFLMGFENAIGILIIGFALWQAFRMNAGSKIELRGPFRLQVSDTSLE